MINFTQLGGFAFYNPNIDFLNEDFDVLGLGSSNFLTNTSPSIEVSFLKNQQLSSSFEFSPLDNQQLSSSFEFSPLDNQQLSSSFEFSPLNNQPKNSLIPFSKKIRNCSSQKNTASSPVSIFNKNNKRTNENISIEDENICKKRAKYHKWTEKDFKLITNLILFKCIETNQIENNLKKLSESVFNQFNKSLSYPVTLKALNFQMSNLQKEKNLISLQDETLNTYKKIKKNLNNETINKIKNEKTKLFFLKNLDSIKKIYNESLTIQSNFLYKKNTPPNKQIHYTWNREDFKDILYLTAKRVAKSKKIISSVFDLSKKILKDFKSKENSTKDRSLMDHNKLYIGLTTTHSSNARYFSNQEIRSKIMDIQEKTLKFCRSKKTEEQIHNFCKKISKKTYKNIPLKREN